MSLSIASVTTAYNGAQRLPVQLDVLLGQNRPLQEIIVVDNASHDNTWELLATNYPRVTVLRMAENLGAAGAWAAGLEYAALQKRHDWVWAFDDDSVPETNSLERLLAGIESTAGTDADAEVRSPLIGMAAMLTINPRTQTAYPPLLWREGFVKPSPAMLGQEVWFADLTYTSGLMIRRELVETIGLPRADFFMDFFDFEYCLRARAHGYLIAVVTGAKLSHEIGDARPVHLAGYRALWPNHAPWREYYLSRNLIYAMWWLYPSRRAKRFVLGHLARHACGMVLFGRDKLAGLIRMAQGCCDGRAGRLGIRFRPEKMSW